MAKKRPSMGDLSGLPSALARLSGDGEPEPPAPVQGGLGLPPGVEQVPGGYVRKVVKRVSGQERVQIRPVALTRAEAREKRKDYYDPVLGWLLCGYKLQKDRTPEEIMADGSSAEPDPSLIGRD